MSREANDWSDKHPYGVAINRQEVIKSGKVLDLLIANPHPNVMRIYRYDDDWVWVEHIRGCVLDNRDRWCPQVDKEKKAYIEFGSYSKDIILKQIGCGLRHLHEIGVAHTDLVGFNIMVTEGKVVKIIDLIGAMPITYELRELDQNLYRKLWTTLPY